MPKLTITQAHSLPLDQVKTRLEALSNRLSEKYGITAKWVAPDRAQVSRTGVTGSISIGQNQVTVALDLNFMLTPLKDKVQNRVQRELREALAANPSS